MTTRSLTKKALAAEAWRPLFQFVFDTVRHRQRIFQRFGLTPGDAKALFSLDRTEGRNMRTLAKEWTCDASNATWVVDRLEERGLAERMNVPADRRVKLVVLTPKGERLRNGIKMHLEQPPPELLELDREALEALRDAAAKLPRKS